MDIIDKTCINCSNANSCVSNCSDNCIHFILNRIKKQFEEKGLVNIITTNTTYHFNKKNAKMKVSQNLLIVDIIIESNIETPIFFHKNQIIEVH